MLSIKLFPWTKTSLINCSLNTRRTSWSTIFGNIPQIDSSPIAIFLIMRDNSYWTGFWRTCIVLKIFQKNWKSPFSKNYNNFSFNIFIFWENIFRATFCARLTFHVVSYIQRFNFSEPSSTPFFLWTPCWKFCTMKSILLQNELERVCKRSCNFEENRKLNFFYK